MKDKLDKYELDNLRSLAHFLEGYVLAKGDLFSLGTHTIETLWKAIKILK